MTRITTAILSPWQITAIEVGLRKLAASNEADRASLIALQHILDKPTAIVVISITDK